MCSGIYMSHREPFIIYHLLLGSFFGFFNKTNKNHSFKSIIFCFAFRFELTGEERENYRKKFQHISTFRYISSLRFSHLANGIVNFLLMLLQKRTCRNRFSNYMFFCRRLRSRLDVLFKNINHTRPINFDNFFFRLLLHG